MKASLIRLPILCLGLVCSLTLQAQGVIPKANWDRNMALQAARGTDTHALLKPLYRMARSGENAKLLAALSTLAQDPELAVPAREFLLFRFTQGLSDMDVNAVNPEVLEFLSGYEVRTLVADEDHPRMAVPLFNIRAAAAGVRNQWDRRRASARAERLFGLPEDRWIDAYLAAGPAERRGFSDALAFASPDQLQRLGRSALTRLGERPELTAIAARAGLLTGDLELLHLSITSGSGPELSRVLQSASLELSDEEGGALLERTLQAGSDSTAALAIAQLAPARLHQPSVRELLFDTLANRKLGATAALVLGASDDPGIQARLSDMASKENGLAQKRAVLALSTDRARKEGEL